MKEPIRRTELRDFHPKEIADAKQLYFEHGPWPPIKNTLIRKAMHSLGWTDFKIEDLRGDWNEIGIVEEFDWDELREAELSRAKAEKLQKDGFAFWLERRFPNWHWRWKYQRHIYKHLKEFDSLVVAHCSRTDCSSRLRVTTSAEAFTSFDASTHVSTGISRLAWAT